VSAVLEATVTVLTLAATVAVLWLVYTERSAGQVTTAAKVVPPRRAEPPLPGAAISLQGAAELGAKSAKLILLEFSDFQCPFCRTFARGTLPAFEQKYVSAGQISLAFWNFPLAGC